jgi:hypothetical protein
MRKSTIGLKNLKKMMKKTKGNLRWMILNLWTQTQLVMLVVFRISRIKRREDYFNEECSQCPKEQLAIILINSSDIYIIDERTTSENFEADKRSKCLGSLQSIS